MENKYVNLHVEEAKGMGKWLVIENKIINLDSVTYIENLGKKDDLSSPNVITIHLAGGGQVVLYLTDDGFQKLTEALFDRSQ